MISETVKEIAHLLAHFRVAINQLPHLRHKLLIFVLDLSQSFFGRWRFSDHLSAGAADAILQQTKT